MLANSRHWDVFRNSWLGALVGARELFLREMEPRRRICFGANEIMHKGRFIIRVLSRRGEGPFLRKVRDEYLRDIMVA